MTSDQRPGFEERDGAQHAWLPRGEVAFGIGIGLVLAAVLVALMPDVRTHMFGGTERRETTVVGVEVGTRSGDSDRPVTAYDLRWDAGGEPAPGRAVALAPARVRPDGPARHRASRGPECAPAAPRRLT